MQITENKENCTDGYRVLGTITSTWGLRNSTSVKVDIQAFN